MRSSGPLAQVVISWDTNFLKGNNKSESLAFSHESCTSINIQCPMETKNPGCPPTYLIFLWLFWLYFISGHEELAIDCRSYTGHNISQWLHWLEGMASHRLSHQILRVLLSKPMESWLSRDLYEPGQHQESEFAEDTEYMPWVSSIHSYGRPCLITCVCLPDWMQADTTIKSVMNGGLDMAQGNVSLHAMIGALYLFNFADSHGDIYNIWNFKRVGKHFGHSSTFANLPDVVSMPAVRTFTAHSRCQKELGDDIVKWYSASMAFMGIDYSMGMVRSDTECDQHMYGVATTESLSDLLITEEL